MCSPAKASGPTGSREGGGQRDRRGDRVGGADPGIGVPGGEHARRRPRASRSGRSARQRLEPPARARRRRRGRRAPRVSRRSSSTTGIGSSPSAGRRPAPVPVGDVDHRRGRDAAPRAARTASPRARSGRRRARSRLARRAAAGRTRSPSSTLGGHRDHGGIGFERCAPEAVSTRDRRLRAQPTRTAGLPRAAPRPRDARPAPEPGPGCRQRCSAPAPRRCGRGPARSPAGISSAELAEEISARARIASRAPGRSRSDVEQACAQSPSASAVGEGARRPRAPLRRASPWSSRSRRGARGRRSACPCPRARARGRSASARDLGVAGEDELGAHLDRRAVGQPPRPGAAADAVARLEHLDLPCPRGASRSAALRPARPAPTTTTRTGPQRSTRQCSGCQPSVICVPGSQRSSARAR